VTPPAWRRLAIASAALLVIACGPESDGPAGTVAASALSAGTAGAGPSPPATTSRPAPTTTGTKSTSDAGTTPATSARSGTTPSSLAATAERASQPAPASTGTTAPGASDSTGTEPTATVTSPASATTATSTTSTPSSATATTVLPGERVSGFGPRAGRRLAVFGVAYDDRLEVRAGPGADQRLVAELGPLDDSVTATGHTRRLRDRTVWHEVETGDVSGWVESGNLFYLGPTNDLTSFVVRRIGRYPEADTMTELAVTVAGVFANPDSVTLAIPVPPSSGDAPEVTVDVGGLDGDSIWGWRLQIVGRPLASDGGLTLAAVEATGFCLRGGSTRRVCS
jgi:hypothetical protein